MITSCFQCLSLVLPFAVVSASVSHHISDKTNTGPCPNGSQISAFPRHMPFARHGMYFSTWRLRTYYLNNGGTYPGGGTDWKDTPITIRVVDENGAPISGCRVFWRTGKGQSNGWVFPSESSITDADGTVRASWIAGSSNRQEVAAGIEHQDGSEAIAKITGKAGGERVLAPSPTYEFDYGENWLQVEYNIKAVHWSCEGGPGNSVFHTVGSSRNYYAGPQCKGVLFTTWWKSPTSKTEIIAPPESQFSLGSKLTFENSTHYCHQCLNCPEGHHASCLLKIPPKVGVMYRQTVMKKFNSWDPKSTLTSYWDAGNCGPRGDDARADVSHCPGGEAKVVESVEGFEDIIISTIEGCDYYSYTTYACNAFDPTSALTSYRDVGACGPRGDDAKEDLSECENGATVVEHKPNVNYQVVAEIDGCKYYAYKIYKCHDNVILPSTDIAVYFDTALSSERTLIGEMRHLSDMRGHTAGGFLETPSGVQYSCLDTALMEVVHAEGRWRGESGPWHDTDMSMLSFKGNRKHCANVWAGLRNDGMHLSAGGGKVGPSDRFLDNSCGNGIKDGDEYDVDCGGGCTPCKFDMISCDDGITNGDEEYIDCGGSCPISCTEKGNAESYFKITSEDNGGNSFTWEEASTLCLAQGSALAIVSTTEQNQVLTELCGKSAKCWIGLHRKDSCKSPSCLKWTPREDGSIIHLDQTIFNHWGCWGNGGGGSGCYWQYKDEYTRYYMYREIIGSSLGSNTWYAAKESSKATVALCGTPPLSLSSPLPHNFW
eukprot:CAMPEP_0194273888 /NCGR_PEP_ID=MMETSP0169-20130528/7129_1 /TAXON_ID=218684 /ORGANISM="Corethron pennatum, Strain L29A3" /LENGTH=770 /DNA_ID=CAMNT_0039016963 /DNA_START=195 /DNA_END=2504 /DNA_ORIENTATION=+